MYEYSVNIFCLYLYWMGIFFFPTFLYLFTKYGTWKIARKRCHPATVSTRAGDTNVRKCAPLGKRSSTSWENCEFIVILLHSQRSYETRFSLSAACFLICPSAVQHSVLYFDSALSSAAFSLTHNCAESPNIRKALYEIDIMQTEGSR